MQITEKTFRRILKEEARRILKEEAAPKIMNAQQAQQAIQASTAGNGANSASLFLSAWEATFNILNTMKKNQEILALSKLMVGRNVLDNAIAKWNGVLVSIANGGSGTEILGVISTQVANTSAANSDVAMFAALALSKSFNSENEAEIALGLSESAFAGGRREKFKNACTGLFSAVAKCEPQFMNASEINKIISQGAPAKPAAPSQKAPVYGQTTPVTPSRRPPAPGEEGYGMPVIHTIVAGESISKIAQDYYGIKPSQAAMPAYTEMAKWIQPGSTGRPASRNPNQIFPGQVIPLAPTVTLDGKQYNRIKNT